MINRAEQQLMALLMNVASGKLAQTAVISADGATVSQAITYSDNLIDAPAGDHERAKTICDEINNNNVVAAGMIPLATANIAYREGTLLPGDYSLTQNYPNPFNPATKIGFELLRPGYVKLQIFNISGQLVTTIHSGGLDAGQHVYTWEGAAFASGIYFYKLSSGGFAKTKKMILLK